VRALLSCLACIGAAGLLSLPIALHAGRLEETTLAATLAAAALQGTALLLLLLIPTKS